MNKTENSFISKVLVLHFAYTDQIVDCAIAKRFLPMLADQDLSISIPTPITVHLEHCPQCQKDLKSLLDLDLRNDQLYVLSQIFTIASDDTEIYFKDLETEIVLFAAMDFSLISPDVLKSICINKQNRQGVISIRSSIAENIDTTDQTTCDTSYSSLFEACFPYSRTPQDVPGQSEADTVHMKSCPQCLGKAQRLMEEIGGICDRANSDVTTRLTLKENTTKETIGSLDYKDWPVNVEVFRKSSDKSFNTQSEPAQSKNIQFHKYINKIAAVAAVLIVVCGLMLTTRTTEAISLTQVYKAFRAEANVHIAQFMPGNDEPYYEKWVSRTSGIMASKTNKQIAYWDINSNIRKVKENDKLQVDKLNKIQAASVKDTFSGSLGVMPFERDKHTPENATWSKIEVLTAELNDANIEIYELTWQKLNSNGKPIFHMWRSHVDVNTRLPIKSENLSKSSLEEVFSLDMVTTIEYIDDDEVLSTAEELITE